MRLFAGGHRGVVTPVPIPNTEVKGSFAEGSAGLARARVGRRRLFYFCKEVSGRGLPLTKAGVARRAHPSSDRFAARAAACAPFGARPAVSGNLTASPKVHLARGIFRLFYFTELGALSDFVTCMGETPDFAGLFLMRLSRRWVRKILERPVLRLALN